jgi:hypothetical protein
MVVGPGEFFRNAVACLKSATHTSLPAADRLALLQSAQMWTDAALIADGMRPQRDVARKVLTFVFGVRLGLGRRR